MKEEIRRDYHLYLKSPEWQIKKSDALKRANYQCQICGVDHLFFPLEIHHRKYPALNGDEPLTDLIAVCSRCHRLIHNHYVVVDGRLRPKNRQTRVIEQQLPAANDPQYELKF